MIHETQKMTGIREAHGGGHRGTEGLATGKPSGDDRDMGAGQGRKRGGE